MPALDHNTKFYKCNQAMIWPLLTDPAGGATTYGTGVRVPGIKTVGLSGTVKNEVLRGDAQLLDTDSVLQDIKMTFTNAKLNLDAMSIIMGGAVVDSGTTPNRKSIYSLLQSSKPKYFKFAALTEGVDLEGGAGIIWLWKCKFDAFPNLGFADEAYHIFGGGAMAVPTIGTGGFMDLELDETEVPLAA